MCTPAESNDDAWVVAEYARRLREAEAASLQPLVDAPARLLPVRPAPPQAGLTMLPTRALAPAAAATGSAARAIGPAPPPRMVAIVKPGQRIRVRAIGAGRR